MTLKLAEHLHPRICRSALLRADGTWTAESDAHASGTGPAVQPWDRDHEGGLQHLRRGLMADVDMDGPGRLAGRNQRAGRTLVPRPVPWRWPPRLTRVGSVGTEVLRDLSRPSGRSRWTGAPRSGVASVIDPHECRARVEGEGRLGCRERPGHHGACNPRGKSLERARM